MQRKRIKKYKRNNTGFLIKLLNRIQCRLVSENRLPCPSGQAGTTLSLTVTLSVVEGCLHPTFIEYLSKLNDIGIGLVVFTRQAVRNRLTGKY
jgi:hypothetical protein